MKLLWGDKMVLLGRRLLEVRKKNKMTQQQLGDAINVTKVSICCYEKSTRTPSLETLIDLATLFNVSLDYLTGMDEYVVADSDQKYGMKVSVEEMTLIKELRKNTTLYKQLLEDPKRVIELINKKIR